MESPRSTSSLPAKQLEAALRLLTCPFSRAFLSDTKQLAMRDIVLSERLMFLHEQA